MDSHDNGKPLFEISGVARREPYLTLDQATSAILSGVPFGVVFPDVDPLDHAALRAWYVATPGVPLNPRKPEKNHTIRPAELPPPNPALVAYPNGEFCKCGGLMVQTGKCKTCTSCTFSEGSCS